MSTFSSVDGAPRPVLASAPMAATLSSAAAGDPARRPERRPRRAHDLGRLDRALDQRVAEHLHRGRLGARLPGHALAGRCLGVGSGVEQHRGDVHAGDAVDERVVRLGKEREPRLRAATSRSPRRSSRRARAPRRARSPTAASCGRVAARTRGWRGSSAAPRCRAVAARCERTWYSRLKWGSSTHTGPALAERHESQLLAEARHQREPPTDVREQLLVRRGLAREDRDTRNVHVG